MAAIRPVDIIFIRGAPGSGKSQVAKALAKLFPEGVRLEVDTIRQMVISVNWKNQQEHINALQISIRLAYDFIQSGFRPVIFVDTFSGDKINRCFEVLRQLDHTAMVISVGLYTTSDELRRRLALRSGDEFNEFEISEKQNDEILNWKPDGEYQIDTTGISPMVTAERIYRQLFN